MPVPRLRRQGEAPGSSAGVGYLDPFLVGLLALAISAAGSQTAWFWTDEASTISAARRPLPQLFHLLSSSEVVHGLYFLITHFWYRIFPVTEFSSRSISSLAVGIAAAGVVVLGRHISSRTVGIASGLVFAVLPRVTWAGSETRVYALSMTAAVWVTVLCVKAVRRGHGNWWALYGAGLAAAAVLHVYILFVIPAHAVAVWVMGKSRKAFAAWVLAAAAAFVALFPFLLLLKTIVPRGVVDFGSVCAHAW